MLILQNLYLSRKLFFKSIVCQMDITNQAFLFSFNLF